MKITIIVPCYNEELVIEILYKRLINVLSNYNDYEIIFINDGSNDNTEYIIDKYRKENNMSWSHRYCTFTCYNIFDSLFDCNIT